jgi:hypothetical protein
MAISEKDLLLALGNEEPQYEELLRKLDEKAVATLSELAKGRDIMLATKAIYLAGLYNKPSGHAIVESAAKSTVLLKRIACASTLVNLTEEKRDKIGEKLIGDSDVNVLKLAIRGLAKTKSQKIKTKLGKLAKESPSGYIRNLIAALPEPFPGPNK